MTLWTVAFGLAVLASVIAVGMVQGVLSGQATEIAAERSQADPDRSSTGSEMISTRLRPCDARRGRNCVVDGDTFRLGSERIRIADIDAPEISNAGCQVERRAGLLARDRPLQLLDAEPFRLVGGERDRDRYGRLLRRAERSGRSLGLVLVEEGLASRWGEPGIAWCKGERR